MIILKMNILKEYKYNFYTGFFAATCGVISIKFMSFILKHSQNW